MDAILCDELLQEIFHRLPSSASPAASLVSKRWLRVFRSSTASLCLTLHNSSVPYLSSFLTQHPYLSSISITSAVALSPADSSDHFLSAIASSCPGLRHLKFLIGPVSVSALLSLLSCPRLFSLTIILWRPLSFRWLGLFRSLRDLSVLAGGNALQLENPLFDLQDHMFDNRDVDLNLDSLSFTGIQTSDYGLNWLYKNCKKLRTLKFKSCEGVGDNASFSGFVKSLQTLQELELRTCRSIVDGVLLKLGEDCSSLNSLLLYDGGSRDSLLQFLSHSKCKLQKLDLRLPLDLDNTHLTAIAENSRDLSSLRLQSCCLVTGEGLKSVSRALGNELMELSLINCDVVERESGLLATLGQNLRRLRKLDLSYNERLVDKEVISMLVSCNYLNELKLRGCDRLTSATLVSMTRNCRQLQIVDVMYCIQLEPHAVEALILNCQNLRQLQVEKSKLSDIARTWALRNLIEVVS